MAKGRKRLSRNRTRKVERLKQVIVTLLPYSSNESIPLFIPLCGFGAPSIVEDKVAMGQ